jgi:hypothetical protein
MNDLELQCWGTEPDLPEVLDALKLEDMERTEANREVSTLYREEPWDHIMPELPSPSFDELLARLERLRA